MSNANGNGKTVTVTILATLLVLGIAGLCAFSLNASTGQAKHEMNREAHGVDVIVQSVGKIAEDVGKMRIAQENQAVSMKNMAEDIAELKK